MFGRKRGYFVAAARPSTFPFYGAIAQCASILSAISKVEFLFSKMLVMLSSTVSHGIV